MVHGILAHQLQLVVSHLGNVWPRLCVTAAAAATVGVTATATVGFPIANFGGISLSVPAPAAAFAVTNGTTTCRSKENAVSGRDGQHITSCGINMLNGAPGQQVAGGPRVTRIILTKVGQQPLRGLRLLAGLCSAAPAPGRDGDRGADISGFCDRVDITITNMTPGARDKCVFPPRRSQCPGLSGDYTLAGLAGRTFAGTHLSIPSRRAPATYVIRDHLNSSATSADAYLTATVPFSWSLSR